jgi:hypothetical protein
MNDTHFMMAAVRVMSLKRIVGACLLTFIVCPSSIVRGEEPVTRFLEQLRQNNLFDLAAIYLDQAAAAGYLTDAQKQDVALDKILLAQESLLIAKSTQQRDAKAAQVEKDLRSFLDANANHPRRPEARLKLADILLSRGQELLEKGDAEKLKAREDFQQARTLFEGTLAELRPLLESMQGAKIEASDRAKVELRERYQGEYRQAEILMAYCGKLIAETYPPDAPDFTAWLTKSEAEFTEVIKKTTGAKEAGRHILSLLYRGQVQAALKKKEEALDSFIRVADVEEDGVFRTWRVQATTEIVKLLANSDEKKFEAAFERADRVLKSAQSNEKLEPDWVDLQFAMIDARVAWSDFMASQPNGEARAKSLRSEARAMLQPLARRAGPQQEKARDLLSSLGVEVKDKSDDKLPDVKDFAEAYKAVKDKLDESRDFNLQLEVLQSRRAEVDDEQKKAIDAEMENVKTDLTLIYEQALQLGQKALQFFKEGDSREELLQTRYFIGFLLIKLERFWEAAAVSDFTSRASLGVELGQKAGGLALFSYQKLLLSASPESKPKFQATMESFSKYLLETWPAAEETRSAIINLIQVALESSDWENAERYLKMLPATSVEYGKISRDLGYILWATYLNKLEELKKNSQPETDAETAIKTRAEFLLTEGWNSLSAELLDERAVQSATALAQIYLKADKLKEALDVINKEAVGPLAVVRNSPQLVPDAKDKLAVLRVNLNALVRTATESDKEIAPTEISDLISEMQKAAEGDEKQVVSSLVILGQDLIEKLRQTKDAKVQSKLAGLIGVLIERAVEASEAVDILEWIGKTLLALATETKSNLAISQPMALTAEKSIAKILALSAKDPALLDDKKKEQLEILQAMAARNRGDFKSAISILTGILKKNDGMFLAQMEAARTYQAWGENAKSAEHYRSAMLGAEPNDKRANTVWGWGRISQRLAPQQNLQEYFFESRYNLAECRFQSGILATDPKDRQKRIEEAYGDIKSTALNFPLLGGKVWEDKFDQLLRRIQRELKKSEVGVQEFKKGK